MALMFNLFVKAGVIPPESVGNQFGFLVDAAHAIVSSLHTSHPDTGVQLAIRLLLPYATVTREVAAAMANILEHYAPTTDHYARTTLSLCMPILLKPVVPMSSSVQHQIRVMILDGCVSLLIHLFRKYERHVGDAETGGRILMLLDGIDLEADVLPSPAVGSCYRLLESECYTMALHLLQTMVPLNGFIYNASVIVKALPIANAIEQYISSGQKRAALDSQSTTSLDRIPVAAKILVHVVAIFGCFLDKSFVDKKLSDERAIHIIACLNDNSSHVSVSVQLWLLRVARSLIENHSEGVFDLHGVTILMLRLSEFSSAVSRCQVINGATTTVDECSITNQEWMELQKLFQGALVKAMYMKNSEKNIHRSVPDRDEEGLFEQYNRSLYDQDPERKKQFERKMLS
jgi:hypothetical protein